MAFTQNHEAATNLSELKPEGDYEAIITVVEERTTNNGKAGLNLTMVIRNDVQGQKYGNACLFFTLWKAVNPTEQDNAVNGYKFGQIMSLGKAAQLPNNKQYKDLIEYCNDLVNKCVLATVKHEEWNGKVRDKVSYLNPTKHPDCKHKFKTKSDIINATKPPVQYANTSTQLSPNIDPDTGGYVTAADDYDDYPF